MKTKYLKTNVCGLKKTRLSLRKQLELLLLKVSQKEICHPLVSECLMLGLVETSEVKNYHQKAAKKHLLKVALRPQPVVAQTFRQGRPVGEACEIEVRPVATAPALGSPCPLATGACFLQPPKGWDGLPPPLYIAPGNAQRKPRGACRGLTDGCPVPV